MDVEWTPKALSDLTRLYAFLAPVNQASAARTIQLLASAPSRLKANPRIGEKLEQFEDREVRRIIVGTYEIRYEVQQSVLQILRIWHTREQR